jgi:hypothetical protein
VSSIITGGTIWTDSTFTGDVNILYQNDKVRNSAFATAADTDLASGALFSALW